MMLDVAEKTFITRRHDLLSADRIIPPTALIGLALDVTTGGARVPAKTFLPKSREKVLTHDSILYETAEPDVVGEDVRIWVARDVPIRWSDVQNVGRDVFCGSDSPLRDYFRQVSELDGYPVKIERRAADHVVTETVSSVERVEVDASLFAPPANFRETILPGEGTRR